MTASIAQRTIPRPHFANTVVKQGHDTGDIVREVLDTYRDSRTQLAGFAGSLRGRNDYETCKKIFDFVKQNIRYQEDPAGKQWVKTPARLWADKVGDCKSFSIFCAACLHNLKIPGCFRFVSFTGSPVPTHVYVVAYTTGGPVKIDPVIEHFDTEKVYNHKIDYDMNALYRLSGVGATPGYNPRPGEFVIPTMPDGTTTDDLIAKAILKQRLEIEQGIMARVGGIGSVAVEASAQVIRSIDDDIKAAISGAVGKGILKKAANAVKRVVMTPFRAIAEVAIPKAAMGFLYGFITRKDICPKLPPKVCAKAEKQQKMARTICGIIGMKEPHFWGLVENGIMKKTGKKPWVLLNDILGMQVSDKVSGIGAIPLLFTSILGPVVELIQKIVSMFKKNPGDVKDMVPAADDFDGWNPTPADQQVIQQQAAESKSTLQKIAEATESLSSVVTSAATTFAASQSLPPVQPVAQYSTDSTDVVPAPAYDLQTTTLPAAPAQPAGMNNTLLLGGLGLAALVLLTRK